MRKEARSRRGQRGNVLLLVTFAAPLLLGLTGLAIDGTVCYIVQAELSAAVDGAALGTGRMLSGVTTDAQAQDIAQAFMNADFRVGVPGFWRASYNGTPTIVATATTADITKTVRVSASANVPLIFMNFLKQANATVGANGVATRRDARIEVVIDRSFSMNGVMADLIKYAKTFTQGFTEGNDEMGLILYSNSAVVAYPATLKNLPYSAALPTSATCPSPCGPDGNFQDNSANDMLHQLTNTAYESYTNMEDGLALAYIELQKAHVRDMLQNHGVDTRQNYVVLFTDGVPNVVSVYLNNPNDPRQPVLQTANTGCSAASLIDTLGPPVGGAVGNGPKIGAKPIIATVFSEASFPNTSMDQLASFDLVTTSNTYVSTGGFMSGPDAKYVTNPNPTSYGCSQSPTIKAPILTGLSDISSVATIPSLDAYGYKLGPNMETGTAGYKYSSLLNRDPSQAPIIWDGANEWGATTAAYPINYDSTNNVGVGKYAQAYQWHLAAWDAVDNIASAIRSDNNYVARGESGPMVVTIMTVGYTGDGGTDAGLLSKVANVSGCYFNNLSCEVKLGPNGVKEGTGIFIPAANTTELNNAFSTLMSTILRLSQ